MEVIKLDVGGSLYTTSRSTLTRYPDSMLGAMFSPTSHLPVDSDAEGHYILDGDGVIFRYVLNFLRRSKLDLPEDFTEWDLLATEADYYQIKELVDAVASLRDKRKVERGFAIQRTEFIEIGECPNRKVYYYLGHPDTLKQIPSLFRLVQKSHMDKNRHKYTQKVAAQYLSNALHCGRIELDFNYCCQGDRDFFEEGRMQFFQEILLLGFERVTTSQPWLFQRKL